MFRIGDFSRIARVSARLLRFYEEIGLFMPARSDAHTGYRYYSVDQLAQLNRIIVLKELGFSLEQARDILRSQISPDELRRMLLLRRSDVERLLATEAQRLRQIESRIAQIESDGRLGDDDVIVRAEPARAVISTRRTAASFAEAREMIGQFRNALRAVLPGRHGGQLIIVSHAEQFEADDLDLEFAWTLEGAEPVSPPARCGLHLAELPAAARMAVCVRVGPPEEAHRVNARIGRFLEHCGEQLDGPGREAFVHLPAQDHMHEAVVEMQFPIAAR